MLNEKSFLLRDSNYGTAQACFLKKNKRKLTVRKNLVGPLARYWLADGVRSGQLLVFILWNDLEGTAFGECADIVGEFMFLLQTISCRLYFLASLTCL